MSENKITFEELIDKLNQLENIYDIEDIPYDIWKKYLKEAKLRAYGLDREEHRWFEITTDVYELPKFPNKYLGIRRASNLYSETMTYSDTNFSLRFMEMEAKEVIIITYKPKTNATNTK